MERLTSLFRDFGGNDFFSQGDKMELPQVDSGSQTLEDSFMICLDPTKQKMHSFYCELHGNHIFIRSKPRSKVCAVMNINYALIKVEEVFAEDNKMWSIKLCKDKSYEQLYTLEKSVADRWLTAMQRYCIKSKFRSYFSSDKVLGKGAFAKVYAVTRGSDGAKFAAKVFDKKLIVKDDIEVVGLIHRRSVY
jgi:hypothetical protein